MLQYILTESHRWSPAELAQMAVEGGCLWISIDLPDLTDAEIREIVEPDIIEMCREASVFLTVDDRPDLARELGLHGVRLSKKYFLEHTETTPLSMREELGPEAVIGIELTDPTALPSLVPADLDFVTLPRSVNSADRVRFIEAIKNLGIAIPVVQEGCRTVDEAIEAMVDGCSGVAVSSMVSDSKDPVTTIRDILYALASC